MRKALFAIVLVAASFAGGAVINGPGLRWLQSMVLSRLDADAEITTVDGPPVTKGSDLVALEPIPTAPIAPLAAAPQGETSSQKNAAAKPGTPSGAQGVAAASPVPSPKAPGTPEPKAAEPVDPKASGLAGEPAAVKPASDPAVALAKGDGSASEMPSALEAPSELLPPPASAEPQPNQPKSEPADAKPKSNESAWADAPGSAPAAAVPPKPFDENVKAFAVSAPSAERTTPATEPARPAAVDEGAKTDGAPVSALPEGRAASDWAELRRKMSALGVSRYVIEGQPGGRVRFSCLIPLAGQRAVAQQFEAEGDDEWQAADAALRRIALWRATEKAAP